MVGATHRRCKQPRSSLNRKGPPLQGMRQRSSNRKPCARCAAAQELRLLDSGHLLRWLLWCDISGPSELAEPPEPELGPEAAGRLSAEGRVAEPLFESFQLRIRSRGCSTGMHAYDKRDCFLGHRWPSGADAHRKATLT